jgi:hypothetical protein
LVAGELVIAIVAKHSPDRGARDDSCWAIATVALSLLDRRVRASTVTSCIGKEPQRALARFSITGCCFATQAVNLIVAGGDAAASRLYEGGPVVKPLCQFADTSLSFAG